MGVPAVVRNLGPVAELIVAPIALVALHAYQGHELLGRPARPAVVL